MTFLQPALLIALPVVLLPIIIHLINQRRFQTVQWAAMQFLLAANRISQGYARIRRWLILAARVAAIAGLIFAISRPLSSGWLGLAGGGRIDTAIVLIDRSPSMTARGAGGVSKLAAGLQKISSSLTTLQPDRLVLIDSANVEAIEVDSPDQLTDLPQTTATGASAYLPAMMEAANAFVITNRPSRCEVWICSDVRRHDWDDRSGRWDVIRQSLSELPQSIRFHLLAYTSPPAENRSLRVVQARRVDSKAGSELLLSMNIRHEDEFSDEASAETPIPLQLELNGARSEFSIVKSGSRSQLHTHLVPIDVTQNRGWGRVSLGPDSVLADNDFFFVYDRPIERKSIIVADDQTTTEPLEFAAAVSSDPDIVCSSLTITVDQWLGADLEQTALVIWHTQIPRPNDPAFQLLESFVDRGGQVLFFPPTDPTTDAFAGLAWNDWQPHEQVGITGWVSDQDLLGRTLDGEALPVGELTFSNSCGVTGDFISLAQVDQGHPILVRAMADKRNVYFCTTTVAATDSSLAENGVVLYAIIHRMLNAGIESLGATGMQTAGEIGRSESERWQRIAGDSNALSTEFSYHSGVYAAGDRLIAINRSAAEDLPATLPDEEVDALFQGLDFNRVEVVSGDRSSLVQEIWRLCLAFMLFALIAEAALCIPSRVRRNKEQSAGASFA